MFRCLLAALALLSLAGCGLAERARNFLWGDDHGTTAVVVGDRTYTRADLQRFFDSRLSDFRDPDKADKVKSNLLDSFVEEKLLLIEAERQNVQPNLQLMQSMLARIAAKDADRKDSTSSAARDAQVEQSLAESLKIQQYLHDHVLKDIKVGDAECEEYYRQHLEEYVRNDVVRVREILVDDRTDAERILASLKENKNKNFGELARVYSKGPSAADGGDLGAFQRGDLPRDFEKVIFPLSPNTASTIVQTRYGYHIFLVEEKILARRQNFYEVKEEIRERLLLKLERELVNRAVETLMRQIPVEIHQDNLDFTYIGTRFSTAGGLKR